jgi:hypothetical protein
LKERDIVENLGIDGRIKLEQILHKQGGYGKNASDSVSEKLVGSYAHTLNGFHNRW